MTHVNGLVRECNNSSALAMELLQSCTKPLLCFSNGVTAVLHWDMDVKVGEQGHKMLEIM